MPSLARAIVNVEPGTNPWKDLSGMAFNLAVQPGSVTAGGELTIQNVTPGGGLLPAGTIVRVEGSGFRPDTTMEVPGVALSHIGYIGPAEIDVTLAGPAELTGKLVRATNPNGSSTDYVSSLRAIPSGPATLRILPLFPLRAYSSIAAGGVPRRAEP